MNPILIDTHVAVWNAQGLLARPAANVLEAAAARGELLLSPISAWEIGTLVHKGRISLSVDVREFVRALFGYPGVVTAALTPLIAVSANSMPGTFHADPADRLLVATAAEYGAQFVTGDRQIHDYAKATKYIRCIAC